MSFQEAKKNLLEEYRKLLEIKFHSQGCKDRKDALAKAYKAISDAKDVMHDPLLTAARNSIDMLVGREKGWWNQLSIKMKELDVILNVDELIKH